MKLHDVLSARVERGDVPGLVALVARGGDVEVEAIGMQRDTIVRVASMTKPITAAATMMLIEEGVLRLDQPVDDLLPELSDRRVLARIDAPLSDTVPALRPISVRDLLTFTMGFGLVFGDFPIVRAAAEQGLAAGPPQPAAVPAPDEWIRRLGALPLMYQPGKRWLYNTGSDVLGVLLTRASGRPFDAFLRDRIFEPLGMKDTDFFVPPQNIGRLATCYADGEVYDPAEDGQWSRPPAFPSGAGGLVSTVDDYLAFTRTFSPATNEITPEQKAGSEILGANNGWGFGVAVATADDDFSGRAGSYGWDGGLGTSWRTDPHEDLTTILLTQSMWTSPTAPDIFVEFRRRAYETISPPGR